MLVMDSPLSVRGLGACMVGVLDLPVYEHAPPLSALR